MPESVRAARAALVDLAKDCGVDREELDAIRLAASEALTNVVQHAYANGGGKILVTAARAAGELWVLVADNGRGLRPRVDRPGMGFGLALIANATDELTIATRSSGGTEIRMRFNLPTAEDQSSKANTSSVLVSSNTR